MEKMNHEQKLKQLKSELESKGYTCKKNSFPVFLEDEQRFSVIDLACWKKGQRPIGIEIESKNTQQLRNKKCLETFKRIHNARTCQIFSDDSLDKCQFNQRPMIRRF